MGNEMKHFPPVSIVVPAYNEEKTSKSASNPY
jgi:glycosyltransferase involved in cell wall biosynthesis